MTHFQKIWKSEWIKYDLCKSSVQYSFCAIIIFLWSTVCNKVNCVFVYFQNTSADSVTQYVLMFYRRECGGVGLQQPLWSGTQVLEDSGDKHVTFVCWITDLTVVPFGHVRLCLLSEDAELLNEGQIFFLFRGWYMCDGVPRGEARFISCPFCVSRCACDWGVTSGPLQDMRETISLFLQFTVMPCRCYQSCACVF